jgi:6-pyruvoyltetrahydropterin/6-carboxytetrahydropterin synthase
MQTLTKVVRFDAAHRLLGYVGPCANLHGHTWEVHVTIEGRIDNESCMMIDFKDLKDSIMFSILAEFDHTAILNNDDLLCKLLEDQRCRVTRIKGNPTCEILAKLFYDRLFNYFINSNYNAMVSSVEVFESPGSSSTFHRGD